MFRNFVSPNIIKLELGIMKEIEATDSQFKMKPMSLLDNIINQLSFGKDDKARLTFETVSIVEEIAKLNVDNDVILM